ncbi:MAG: DUF4037 domain-containing protein [Clostridiales Family XIII bacterium]|jgi:hypothetical protein|nr:DUF4037 domain-containing protein [Clostridiales Family XIII bacterium]
MKGLELARAYYEHCGAPMLAERFADVRGRIACGLVGEGSECFGFDDEISQDHDFGAAFCIWLTDADYERFGTALSDAYEALPSEFMGYGARPIQSYGEQRVGVMRTTDFYRRFTGLPRAPQTLAEWRRIPESYLAVATNGAVFADPLGDFTGIRITMLDGCPEDLRRKRLAARLAVMAQAGQYNLPRSLGRLEFVAAEFAKAEFLKAACSAVYLLNRRHMPFYKWAQRGMVGLARVPGAARMVEDLALAPMDDPASPVTTLAERLCIDILGECKAQNLTDGDEDYLLPHAYRILATVEDEALRSIHIFGERMD